MQKQLQSFQMSHSFNAERQSERGSKTAHRAVEQIGGAYATWEKDDAYDVI